VSGHGFFYGLGSQGAYRAKAGPGKKIVPGNISKFCVSFSQNFCLSDQIFF